MKFLSLLSCLALLTLLSCTKEPTQPEGKKKVADHEADSTNDPLPETDFFNPSFDFSISAISRPHDYPSSFDDTSICEEWELTEDEIKAIIKGAEQIGGVAWDFSFDHLPCTHRAVLKQGEKEYELSLNEGS